MSSVSGRVRQAAGAARSERASGTRAGRMKAHDAGTAESRRAIVGGRGGPGRPRPSSAT